MGSDMAIAITMFAGNVAYLPIVRTFGPDVKASFWQEGGQRPNSAHLLPIVCS